MLRGHHGHTSRMEPRRVASLAAVLAGLAWAATVALAWAAHQHHTGPGPVGVAYLTGLGCLVLALGAAGYTLVTRAPVWLRAVVVVATPLLGVMVLALLGQGVEAVYPGDSWLRDELSTAAGAVLALLLGLVGLWRRRYPTDRPTDHRAGSGPAAPGSGRGRRAAR